MNKIPVAILGATGIVGQKLVELLSYHPWFQIVALAASENSQGKKYGEVTKWMMPTPLPKELKEMKLSSCAANFSCKLLFSALDAAVAGDIETACAEEGYVVVSNARNHRMDPSVPLVIPEVNSSHIDLIQQRLSKGVIVTNPNCSVIGLTLALKPLVDKWGVERVHVVTLQAISGAGYPGLPSFDIVDNVIPFIAGEEEKVEREPLKILGDLSNGAIHPYNIRLSAQCNRVAVMDGHTACISVKLNHRALKEEIIHAWENFATGTNALTLPSAPQKPIFYHADEKHPQPKFDRDLGEGMSISVGRLRPCPLFDWKFVLLSHNTIRGAAGGAVLNAELLVKKGYLDKINN